ncbi:MAG: ATP-binding protein [Firmicutes bacterium]|nr:ATP-binding protein [Bacillota bacterium]
MNSLELELSNAYNKVIPSKVEVVGYTVNEVIQYLIDNCGAIHDDILFELRVILNELLLNAVIHGNKENKDKLVRITVGITKNKCILMMVTDDGEGYDYNFYLEKCEESQDTFCWSNIEERGRGIKIIKKLCDKVEFNKEGNKISILKSLEKHPT